MINLFLPDLPKNPIYIILTATLACFGTVELIRKFIKASNKYRNNKYTWNNVESGVKKMLSLMKGDNYIPDAIICNGRGGAVIGALMSNKFYHDHNVPLFMMDRLHKNKDGRKIVELLIKKIEFVNFPKKVLVVSGVSSSGVTLEKYCMYMKDMGVSEIKTAVFVSSNYSKEYPEYCYKRIKIDPELLQMPWYKGGIIDWVPQTFDRGKH